MPIIAVAIIVMLVAVPSCGQTKKEPACQLQELAIAAALGDPDSQYDLGVAFHRGVDVPQDLAKAAALWRMASNAGVIPAHNNLGYLAYYGRGIEQNHAEGLRLWRIAAERGFAESQVHIADAYSDGKYLKPDFVEAYAWAKTGEHFSKQMGDELAGQVATLAQKTLAGARRKLTDAQLVEAEKKAADYIARYAPKP